jgi:hypothetical protein
VNAKGVFGVIIRVIGLACIGYGFSYVMSWVYILARHNAPKGWSGTDYFVTAVPFLAIGFLLLRKADFIVEFAYPEKRKKTTDSGKTDNER